MSCVAAISEQQQLQCFLLFQVHVRVASPPLLYPCYMGINIPTREELIANKLEPVKLAKHVGK
jgi:glutamine phosphoribosylpyrophosphate amidotransferase